MRLFPTFLVLNNVQKTKQNVDINITFRYDCVFCLREELIGRG